MRVILVRSITDKLDNSDLAPTELRNMYGSISKKVSEGIPKVLNTLEDELNRRIKEPVNIRNLSDLKEFCSKSKSNHRAIKESLLSAVERIGSGGSKVVSAIKTILKTLSYGVLKTVQAVSAVFMLSFLAWPAMVAEWPIKGTAIIISAIIGLIGPVMIAQRVDDRMFKGLL